MKQMQMCAAGIAFLIGASIAQEASAQLTGSRVDGYQREVEQKLKKSRDDYLVEKEAARASKAAANAGYGFSNRIEAEGVPLSKRGSQWKISTTRYSCAGGLALVTKQRLSSADFTAGIAERRDAGSTARGAIFTKNKPDQIELDALDDLDLNLKKIKPVTLTFKYKNYQLNAEKALTGWHLTNRTQGISWAVKQGKGTLKNSYSGRVLAQDCRGGSPFVTDAPESEDDDLAPFAARSSSVFITK